MSFAVPVSKKIPWIDPAKALLAFGGEAWLSFLDSAGHLGEAGRYSYIVMNPFAKIMAVNSQVTLNGMPVETGAFETLRQVLARYPLGVDDTLPPFQGGALGYLGYDLLHDLENVPHHPLNDMMLPDMMIGLYDSVIALDHERREAWVISRGICDFGAMPCMELARQKCSALEKRVNSVKGLIRKNKKFKIKLAEIRSNFDKDNHCQTVQKVIDYIYSGDIFQANLSQCFSATSTETIDALALYLTLREKNPAPFAAFLQYPDFSVASASPERFSKLHKKQVETRPIKGTRARSVDPILDRKLAQALVQSEKDNAENIMIVDLMRNDLSRVCADNSVKVKQLCHLERYETVHHLVSVVEGALRQECDAIDLLLATFPGGSITGAPKIRAMEIIAELEPTARGPYCGSIGYIGFDGSLDTSIVIRTMMIKGNQVTVAAGGGIVADPNPEEEYEETLTKAERMLQILMETDDK